MREVGARPKVGRGYEAIKPFVLGNRPHVVCYSSEEGAFRIFELNEDLEFSRPFQFTRSHGSETTAGFTMVEPIVVHGQVALMGYNGENGQIALYALSVVAETHDGTPPLRMRTVWSHQWSKGWTRFAFFKLGGGCYFLKTNTVRPNVNIDHVLDGMDGVVPVGTKLELKGAQGLKLVEPFELDSSPYFITYETGGEMTVNRIRSDCKGWTTESTFLSKPRAAHALVLDESWKKFILVS